MHRTDPERWGHGHAFCQDSAIAERRTRIVIGITATMMLVEIITGMAFHSMALLADGWHLSTHVTAFFIAALAYHYNRRHSADPRYPWIDPRRFLKESSGKVN